VAKVELKAAPEGIGITTLKGTPLATGTLLRQIFYQLPYYVDATLNGCTSTSRIASSFNHNQQTQKTICSGESYTWAANERLILLVEYI
jgi:hypothetical protein